MNFRSILPVLAVVSGGLGGCVDQQVEQPGGTTPSADSRIVGGWQATTVNDEVRQAAAFAVAGLGKTSVGLKAITNPEYQVVAGMNYAMTLELNDGSRWHVVVYRALDGHMQLTQSAQL